MGAPPHYTRRDFSGSNCHSRVRLSDGSEARAEKVGNGDIFQPLVGPDVTRNRMLDEILSFFGGRAPLMAQLADAGKLTPEDVRELEKTLRKLKARQKEESK